MENIPRQRSLSLKVGSILTALFFMVLSVLYLARCSAALCELASKTSVDNADLLQLGVVYLPDPQQNSYHSHGVVTGVVIAVTISHSVTLFLTALMLVGVLREKLHLIRPWLVWTWIQLIIYVKLTVRLAVINFINHSDGYTWLMYVVGFLRLFVRFNLLMIVVRFCKQLKEEQFDGGRVKILVNQDTRYNSA